MSDRWYYRVFGQEFGPVSLDLVRTLVAAGTIAPDDEVRHGSRSNWILACAAAELCNSSKSSGIDLAVERRAVRDEWFCRGVSGDFGPLTLSDLIQLAAIGDLKPDEQVKSKADDYWRQLRSIRRLCELLPFPDPDLKPPQTTRLAIFVDDSPSTDVAVKSLIASTRDPETPDELACCLPQGSGPVAEHDETASPEMADDTDNEPEIFLFPGVRSTTPGDEPTCSAVALDNPNLTMLVDAVQRPDNTEAEETKPELRRISVRNTDFRLTFNRLRNHANAIGISILISIGLFVFAWIAVR